jgi:hypothetical protein
MAPPGPCADDRNERRTGEAGQRKRAAAKHDTTAEACHLSGAGAAGAVERGNHKFTGAKSIHRPLDRGGARDGIRCRHVAHREHRPVDAVERRPDAVEGTHVTRDDQHSRSALGDRASF